MPRPRRDSEILPAKERMENAFWELLASRDYHKITVTDIVREADVNRNSFYYHFSSLSELADAAILHMVENTPVSLPRPNTNPETAWRTNIAKLLQTPGQREHLDRLALVTGAHGSAELLASLRDFSRMNLMSILQIDAEHLDLQTDLMLEFAIGGMLAILRRWPELSDHIETADLLNDDAAALAMSMYLSLSKTDMLGYWRRVFNPSVAPRIQ